MEQQAKGTHRRYSEGRDFYYDFAWSEAERLSNVLNQDFQEFQVSELDDLLKIKEKRLQELEEDLEDLITVQKISKQTAFNKGQEWDEDRSREKRVTLEARVDSCKSEIDKLEQAIQEAEAEKEKEKSERLPCLPHGPQGENSVPGSIGEGFVDGQFSKHVGNVGLVIVDERSRYRGMSVMDYIENIAKPWIIASKEYKSKLWREGKDKEVHHGPGRGSRFVPWPEWPANVKNHLSNSKANGQASLQRKSPPKMIRTK